jgi:hypothetical protein
MYGSDLEKQMNIAVHLEDARRSVESAYREYFDGTPLLLPGVAPNYNDMFREVMDTLETMVKETAAGIANSAQIKIKEVDG